MAVIIVGNGTTPVVGTREFDPIPCAPAAGGSGVTFGSGDADDFVITSTGVGNQIQGEEFLQFDGNTLLLEGDLNIVGGVITADSIPAGATTNILSYNTGTGAFTYNASGGGSTNFLRADGTWASPAGTYVHPNHTGQVTSVADGVTALTVSAITAQTALTVGLASTDELLVNDAGSLRRMDISVLEAYMQSALSFGTVTSVAAGNGMDFASITSTGSVTLGTPGTLTPSSTNTVTATSHTHVVSGFVEITGTPVNNQVAVWTSATNIEGDSNFTWSGSTLTIGGSVTLSSGDNLNILDTGVLDQYGHIMLVGSDNLSEGNRTDNIAKWGAFGIPHYTNADTLFVSVSGLSGPSHNTTYIGGGNINYHGATRIYFLNESSRTSNDGTIIASIDSTGFHVNDINEWTSGHGIDIEGAHLQDSVITLTNAGYLDQYGAILKIGADSSSWVARTNSTNKLANIVGAHYTNAEEDISIMRYSSLTSNSYVTIGGGSTSHNAVTSIGFFAAADNTTLAGTIVGGFSITGFEVDVINELNPDLGVTIDGVLLKDGGITLGTGPAVDTIETTISDDDTHLPTSGAVVDAIAAAAYVFDSGLTEVAGNVDIGGALTTNVQFTGSSWDFNIGANSNRIASFGVDTTVSNTIFSLGASSIGIVDAYPTPTAEKSIAFSSSTIVVTDSITTIGLQYAADYSTAGGALGARWIPDKGYVDSVAGGAMVYPGAGIALSTGSSWGTSITDNSANWNTAYSWGDHAGLYDPAGTMTTHESTYNHANYDTAYGWGDHAVAGYSIISGTPANNQLAIWTNSTTIEGDSNLTWDTFSLYLGVSGSRQTIISHSAVYAIDISNDSSNQMRYVVYSNTASLNNKTSNQRYGGTIATPAVAPTNAVVKEDEFLIYDGTSEILGGRQNFQVVGAIATGNFETTYNWYLKSGASASALFLTLGGTGLYYANDYSVGATDRWIPDKAYVDSAISGSNFAVISGTPANNQIAVWTGTTDIEGDPDFTWDGNGVTITSNSFALNFVGTDTHYTRASTYNASALSVFTDTYFRYGATGATVAPSNSKLHLETYYVHDGTTVWNSAAGTSVEVDGAISTGSFATKFTWTTRETTNYTQRLTLDSWGFLYYADYSSTRGSTDRWIPDRGYVTTHIGTKSVTSVVSNPTGTEDGYSITWDNGTGQYTLTNVTGGTTSPAGSTTEIQYNNAGSFGASSNFTYDSSTGILTVHGPSYGQILGGSSSAFYIRPGASGYMGIGSVTYSNTFITIQDSSGTPLTNAFQIYSNQGGGATREFYISNTAGGVYFPSLASDDTEDHVVAIDDSTGLLSKRSVASISSGSTYDRTGVTYHETSSVTRTPGSVFTYADVSMTLASSTTSTLNLDLDAIETNAENWTLFLRVECDTGAYTGAAIVVLRDSGNLGLWQGQASTGENYVWGVILVWNQDNTQWTVQNVYAISGP